MQQRVFCLSSGTLPFPEAIGPQDIHLEKIQSGSELWERLQREPDAIICADVSALEQLPEYTATDTCLVLMLHAQNDCTTYAVTELVEKYNPAAIILPHYTESEIAMVFLLAAARIRGVQGERQQRNNLFLLLQRIAGTVHKGTDIMTSVERAQALIAQAVGAIYAEAWIPQQSA